MFPKLFDLGPLPIHTYGLLLALGMLASIELMSRLGARQGIDRNKIWDLGFIAILSALVGAKLMLVVTNLERYWGRPSDLLTWEFLQSAGVYYGGLLGAVGGVLIFLWRNPELRFWQIADLAAPCIALGQTIGRLGCFFAGCDYGKPSDLPWAVTFTSEYAQRHVGVPLGISLHPTQVYESLGALALFLFLLHLHRKDHFKGQIFLLYLIGYSVLRFGVEFVRGDIERGLYFDGLISTSQIISLILFPLAILLYRRRSRNRRKAASA